MVSVMTTCRERREGPSCLLTRGRTLSVAGARRRRAIAYAVIFAALWIGGAAAQDIRYRAAMISFNPAVCTEN